LRLPAIIFAVALAVRLAYAMTTLPAIDQQYETSRVALSLADHGAFADPFRLPTGPTAHLAPGFPLVLAAVYKIFGAGLAGETAKRILGCVVSSLGYALLPALSAASGWGPGPGVAAGLLGAVFPLNRYEEIAGNWESPWAALALIALAWMCLRKTNPLRFGATGGLALLFAPAIAPVFAMWSLWSRRFRLLALLPALLLLLPWAARNRIHLGEWIWMRDNLGLELSLSNNAAAAPTMRENIASGMHAAQHPSLSILEGDRVCYWGEPEYNRRRLDMARAWIAANPGRFLALTAARMRRFWFSSYYFSALLVLALAGLYRTPNAWVFATLWLTFPLLYYFVQFDPRYRHPMEWSVLLMASKGAYRFVRHA
jgi:hypothetical protein